MGRAPVNTPVPLGSSAASMPDQNSFANTMKGIGLGLDTALLDRPYTPGPVRFIGRALASFGRSSQAMETMQEENARKAALQALEAKLGVPADFFVRLSADAQKQILQRAGIEPADLKKEIIPGFGVSYDELMTKGIAPKPEVPGTYPPDYAMQGPPSPGQAANPGIPPLSLLSPADRATAVGQYTGSDLTSPSAKTLNDLRVAQTGLANAETANVKAGKGRSGTGGAGRQEAMAVTAAKRLAELQPGTDWRDFLVAINNGEYKVRRIGGTQTAVFAPDGSQVTTFNYAYSPGGAAPQAGNGQAPDPASLSDAPRPGGKTSLRALATEALAEKNVATLKGYAANKNLPKEILPFVQYRITQLGG